MEKKLKKIVFSASKIFKKGFFNINKSKTNKASHQDIVTKYDKAVEDYIKEELKKKYPKYNFIGEENKVDSLELKNTFILDPIDGTSNFFTGNEYCCISLAVYKKGKPYIGIVYNPIRKEYFYAKKGQGAFLNGRKIKNKKRKINHSLGSLQPKIDDYKLNKIKKYFSKSLLGQRGLGSAALEISYIALNQSIVYIHDNIYIWDIAASSLILKESGGFVKYEMEKDNPLKVVRYLAGSKLIKEKLKKEKILF